MKNPAQSECSTSAARGWFRDLLFRAFPGRSEREIARVAAPLLDVSDRQVRNWLREEHDPGLTVVLKVMALAGAEVVLARVERRR
ncbi:hypothetical protein [Jannaschia formosa]|uniref:hypothetical protein n=1 Tax=Jannaschia formosa TaxID=2259592 RepID=UPI000E1B72D5|nr:hypothetical protein [Jannaschia formosa]TFL16413.1 hypothetical protein DR046_20025 [Jannaschia formosa]